MMGEMVDYWAEKGGIPIYYGLFNIDYWAKNEGVVCVCDHEKLVIGLKMRSGIVKMGKDFGHVGHLVK